MRKFLNYLRELFAGKSTPVNQINDALIEDLMYVSVLGVHNQFDYLRKLAEARGIEESNEIYYINNTDIDEDNILRYLTHIERIYPPLLIDSYLFDKAENLFDVFPLSAVHDQEEDILLICITDTLNESGSENFLITDDELHTRLTLEAQDETSLRVMAEVIEGLKANPKVSAVKLMDVYRPIVSESLQYQLLVVFKK